jgi:hypothetical protein
LHLAARATQRGLPRRSNLGVAFDPLVSLALTASCACFTAPATPFKAFGKSGDNAEQHRYGKFQTSPRYGDRDSTGESAFSPCLSRCPSPRDP